MGTWLDFMEFHTLFSMGFSYGHHIMGFPILGQHRKIAIEIVDLPIKNGDLVGFNGIY